MELKRSKMSTRDLVETALLIAIVYVSTAFINVKLPFVSNGGLVHFGTSMLFVAAIVFGKKKGAVAGAFGMAIFDLLGGWVTWAPFTFIIRGLMGYILGTIAHRKDSKGNNIVYNIIGILLSSILMVVGYYLTEVILYGNWVTPVNSIPGNLAQIVIGTVIALPLSKGIAFYKNRV